jgi:hypothetical protein
MKECGMERVMSEIRILRIFEGKNEIMRIFVDIKGIKFDGINLREIKK